jgi:SAM-dependent methyltransferase
MAPPPHFVVSFRKITILICLSCQSLAFWIGHGLPTRERPTKPVVSKAVVSIRVVVKDDDGASSTGPRTSTNSASTSITDWVVENLESSGSSITTKSATMAGENDTLPLSGLPIGPFRILASEASTASTASTSADKVNNDEDDGLLLIRLLVGRNGWGTGVHPTTRLCLEWLGRPGIMYGGEVVLDYGCGSGILSIAALHLGAARCIGVDVEAEALVTAVRNAQLNDFGDRFEPLHTREILPYDIVPPANVCLANILIGQLVRPSMVAAILSNLAPNGLLCLSGIRPGEQVESLRKAYGHAVDWIGYEELSAKDTIGSIDSYGFDCGTWCRLVGRKRISGSRDDDIARMSELAVS